MLKIIRYTTRGLLGVLINSNLSTKNKILLYIDYVRLISHIILSDHTKPGHFYFYSFRYNISYENIFSLFFIVNEIFCTGEYKVYNNLKSFIDLGSNIGIAVLWYHWFNPKMKIYCYEPDRQNFRYLHENMKQNGIRNCHLYNAAVSNKIGFAKFYQIIDNIQNLDSGLTLNLKLPHKIYKVKTQKVSSLVKKLKHVSLLKMDIEGGEKAVFEDLLKTNAIMFVDKIIFENHFFNTADRKIYKSNILKLSKIGTVHSTSKTDLSSINVWVKNIS